MDTYSLIKLKDKVQGQIVPCCYECCIRMQMTNHILYLIPLFLNKRVRQIDQFVHVVFVEIKSIKVDLLKQTEPGFLNYSQIHTLVIFETKK